MLLYDLASLVNQKPTGTSERSVPLAAVIHSRSLLACVILWAVLVQKESAFCLADQKFPWKASGFVLHRVALL